MINYLRKKLNEWDKYQEASVVKTDRVYISLLLTLSSFSNRLIGQGEMINLGYVRETLLVLLQLEKKDTLYIFSLESKKLSKHKYRSLCIPYFRQMKVKFLPTYY